LTWQDIERLRSRTQVPLVLKGVLSAADARRAVDIGADGIVVSNHGGRQLDGAVPALWALENIAAEVAGDCTLLVDGGIRCGADVVAALALGADAVCIGRPYLWGLRLAGESGVTAVLDILRREITDTVRQIGLASVADIDRDCVVSRGVCG
jgi:4-hydroxymandelate oxidase